MTEITLLNYWKVFQAKKGFLFAITIFSAGIMAFVASSAPREYTASVTTFPPSEGGGSLSILRGLNFSGITGGGATSVTSLAFLVKSRRMAEGIVERFNLAERLQTNREEAIKKASRMVSGYDLAKGTLFVVEATTGDPKLSADLANFCVEYLNTINEQLNLTTQKPMLKVIDPALSPERPNSRYIGKKVMSAALFSGIASYFFFFFAEYARALRERERKTVAEDAEEILKGV